MFWIAFIGEGRSGHTIVSAILDAHPHLRIAEEQKYISKWYRNGRSKEQIIKHLLDSGYGKERKLKAIPGMLTYKEPLMGIGDKCGWEVVNEVRKRGAPISILSDFSKFMGMPVKVIHTSRNPYNNIASWAVSPKYKRLYGEDDYQRARILVKRYSRFYATAEKIMSEYTAFHLRNEDLCLNLKETLQNLCGHLEIDFYDDWYKDVKKRVFSVPNKNSFKIEWPGDIEEMIRWRIINRFPSLSYYK